MGSIAGGRLAGAVSEAGGLGLIGGGYGERNWLEQEFAAAGNQRVGCGFITWSLANQPGLLDVALAHRPAALMLSFGDPQPFATRIHAAAAILICQVQCRDHALQALDAGAEIIVAQGTEAGGHGGTRASCHWYQLSPTSWPGARPRQWWLRRAALLTGAGLPQRWHSAPKGS